MYRRTATEEIIQEVLKDDYIRLDVVQYTITESVGPAPCEVAVKMRKQGSSEEHLTISGQGVGFVDALYTGLVDFYAAEYPSLATISVIGFEVDANMGSTRRQGADLRHRPPLSSNTEECLLRRNRSPSLPRRSRRRGRRISSTWRHGKPTSDDRDASVHLIERYTVS